MGKLGWTEYEYYTCSPYMFLAACEGFFDKENEQSRLLRVHALCIVQASGAKTKVNTDVKATDLWLIRGEKEAERVTYTWGSKEDKEKLWAEIERTQGVKLS